MSKTGHEWAMKVTVTVTGRCSKPICMDGLGDAGGELRSHRFLLSEECSKRDASIDLSNKDTPVCSHGKH